MEWSFQKITLFPRGTLAALLRDAYSFDSRWEVAYGGSWREFDAFFFDHPEIADRCGFFSVLDGVPIGFVSWDPRRLPESVEIGHNCIRSDWKGRGFGTRQMREALRRISVARPRKIFVVTSAPLLPAQRMYERAGFREGGREPAAASVTNIFPAGDGGAASILPGKTQCSRSSLSHRCRCTGCWRRCSGRARPEPSRVSPSGPDRG